MRLPLVTTRLLAALAVLQPSAVQAELVAFKATGSVMLISSGDSDPATVEPFLARFPTGTPVEITFTFDSTTAATSSTSTFASYGHALNSMTVRVGDYTAVGSDGNIYVHNDAAIKVGTPKSGACVNGSGRDFYTSEGLPFTGPAVLEGVGAPVYASIDVTPCSGDPAAMLESTALPTVPPSVAGVHPGWGLTVRWDAGHTPVHLFAEIETFILVPVSNTATGSNVIVAPTVTLPNGSSTSVSLSFDNVTSSGNTSVTASSQGPAPPSGFKLTNPPVYYDITTTATFTGNVRVCLSWTEGQIANENNVTMFHYENNQWADITDATSRDMVNNTVCGTTTSLSPFTLFEVKYPFAGFFSPVGNLPTTNAVKAGSAVPVKFGLGGDLGSNIFAQGFPVSQQIQCDTGSPIDTIEETVTAGSSSLSYNPETGQYTYVWKTDSRWFGCRELHLKLTDGETYKARFTMK